MALDTANKRFAMINAGLSSIPIVGLVPSSGVDADDRLFLLGLMIISPPGLLLGYHNRVRRERYTRVATIF